MFVFVGGDHHSGDTVVDRSESPADILRATGMSQVILLATAEAAESEVTKNLEPFFYIEAIVLKDSRDLLAAEGDSLPRQLLGPLSWGGLGVLNDFHQQRNDVLQRRQFRRGQGNIPTSLLLLLFCHSSLWRKINKSLLDLLSRESLLLNEYRQVGLNILQFQSLLEFSRGEPGGALLHEMNDSIGEGAPLAKKDASIFPEPILIKLRNALDRVIARVVIVARIVALSL